MDALLRRAPVHPIAPPARSAPPSAAGRRARGDARNAAEVPLAAAGPGIYVPRRRHPALAGGVAALHLAVLWGLMSSGPLRPALDAVAPIVVRIVSDAVAPAPALPTLPAPRTAPAPAAPTLPVPEVRIAETTPVYAPPPAVVTAAPAAAPPVERTAIAVAVVPTPPAPAPRTLARDEVSYSVPPVLAYPLSSRRAREQGTAQVRLLVNAQGQPQQVQLVQSTGFDRLDEAALAAARATRFRPHLENGQPAAFWVVIPLAFELAG